MSTFLVTCRYILVQFQMLRDRTAVPRVFNRNGSDRLVILQNEDLDPSTSLGRPIGPEYYDTKSKLDFMNAHDIDMSVLSLANPWLDFLPGKEAENIATLLNNDLQAICEGDPRFMGFGVLPTLSASGSIAELDNVAKQNQMLGVIMGTNGLGKGLDDPELEPVLKKAADEELMIFLHPHYSVPSHLFGPLENVSNSYLQGHTLPLALGFPFETTIAVSRMILCGIFDRIPHLKMMIAHSGSGE
jgi:aminocarboxymuconate-semialdehyde decarboxylase